MTTLQPMQLFEIQRLSSLHREVLVSHVAHNQQMRTRSDTGAGPWPGAKLIELKCLQLIEGGRTTRLTERGRHAAAFILGQYADALVAAGCLERDARPLDILQRLKGAKGPKPDTPADLAALMSDDRNHARR